MNSYFTQLLLYESNDFTLLQMEYKQSMDRLFPCWSCLDSECGCSPWLYKKSVDEIVKARNGRSGAAPSYHWKYLNGHLSLLRDDQAQARRASKPTTKPVFIWNCKMFSVRCSVRPLMKLSTRNGKFLSIFCAKYSILLLCDYAQVFAFDFPSQFDIFNCSVWRKRNLFVFPP